MQFEVTIYQCTSITEKHRPNSFRRSAGY